MSSYLYYQHEQEALNNRFNIEPSPVGDYKLVGLEDWQELISLLLQFISAEQYEQPLKPVQDIRNQIISELVKITDTTIEVQEQEIFLEDRSTEELIATLLLLKLRRYPALPKKKCPRLFISHRQVDKNYALAIARTAQTNGFAFWVDVLDPHLKALTSSSVPGKLIPLVTACIIEFALINCTHVIACMTGNWRGSMWVPYEYGRIRDLPGLSVNTCAWIHPNLARIDFPEYMLLGEIALTRNSIETWLKAEYRLYKKNLCILKEVDPGVFNGVDELPELSDKEITKREREFREYLNKEMPVRRNVKGPDRLRFRNNPPNY